MKEQELVTIVIPVYNVEKYISKCVKSVLSQSYNKLEVILVDDGSTDNSGAIADEFSKKDERVIAFHKKNGGLSSARNFGIKKAHGKWICFVDSDDYVNKYYIEKLHKETRNGSDVVTCSLESFSNEETVLKKSPKWPTCSLSGKEAIDDMMKNRRPAYICLSIFKLRLFKDNKINFPEGRNYEDLATRIKLFYFSKKVSYINEQLYYYLIRKDSITGAHFTQKRYDDYIYAVDDIKKFLSDTDCDKRKYKYLNYFEYYSYNTLLNYLARERMLNNANKVFWKKIRKKMYNKYLDVAFPSVGTKIKNGILLLISFNKTLYSKLYRRMKR